MILITKVGKIDPVVSEKLTTVYRSVEVNCSGHPTALAQHLDSPMSYVVPVKS